MDFTPTLKNVNQGFLQNLFPEVENFIITRTYTNYLVNKLKFEAKAAVWVSLVDYTSWDNQLVPQDLKFKVS